MDRCNELCTKDATGTCAHCEALAERDRFLRFWFKGGLILTGIHAGQRWGNFVFRHQSSIVVFGVLLLLLVLFFVESSPGWDRHVSLFLRAHPLSLGVLGLSLLYGFLWKLPKGRVVRVDNEKDRIDLEWKARQTMAQIIGGAVLLCGLYFTAQTLRTSQESQITDRFTKAVEQLGKNTPAASLGGIYALERIAKDSAERDYWTVMEVLTGFVREHAPLKENPGAMSKGRGGVTMALFTEEEIRKTFAELPATNIQAILNVLRRRTKTYGNGENQRLDLSRTNLRKSDLREASFRAVDFTKTDLMEADLTKADLRGADLRGAILIWANLTKADLRGADLSVADVRMADLTKADLRGADLGGTTLGGIGLGGIRLRGTDLRGTDLRGVQVLSAEGPLILELEGTHALGLEGDLGGYYSGTGRKSLTQNQVNMACIDENTKLPEGLTRPAPCPAKP